jgi:hypothetical protein
LLLDRGAEGGADFIYAGLGRSDHAFAGAEAAHADAAQFMLTRHMSIQG